MRIILRNSTITDQLRDSNTDKTACNISSTTGNAFDTNSPVTSQTLVIAKMNFFPSVYKNSDIT